MSQGTYTTKKPTQLFHVSGHLHVTQTHTLMPCFMALTLHTKSHIDVIVLGHIHLSQTHTHMLIS